MTSAEALPRLIVTGSSGFVGRHLLDRLKYRYRIIGIARRSQARCGAPQHPNISWMQADIGDRRQIEAVFDRIRADGGAETVVHLAAHYDFTGEEHPEYWRTNVDGLRNVLDLSRDLGVRHLIFSSSVAACSFPPAGHALTEQSAPDGDHIYARTKCQGERMLREYRRHFHPIIVRFAALFSDWCEYPPLFMFLATWLSNAWNRRVLGGKGLSAIPYLHVRDLVGFLDLVLDRRADLDSDEVPVLVASTDGAVSHRQLFEAATLEYFGVHVRPQLMPRLLCRPGMQVLDAIGRLTGDRPFERPWMANYIDLALSVDASWTRQRLGWAPNPRLEILRRLPFLIENFKTDPGEWNRRNREAIKRVHVPNNLKLHWLLEKHEDEIIRRFDTALTGPGAAAELRRYQQVSPEEHQWNHRLILRHLMNAVRTREKSLFVAYCRDLAERRFTQGFTAQEVCAALEALNIVCYRVVGSDPESTAVGEAMHDYITQTLRFGCDQVQETFELMEQERAREQGQLV